MRRRLLLVLFPMVLFGCGGPAAPAAAPGESGDDAATEPAGGAPAAEPGAGAAEGTGPARSEGGAEAAAPKPSQCDAKKAPEGETDNQRKRRLKKEKIAECQTVHGAIQKAQLQDAITTVDDKKVITKVIGQLKTAADELDQLDICVEGLRKLRDEYRDRVRTMAKALETAIGTTEIEKQKASVAEFRKLQPLQTAFPEKITEFCNAPVE